MDVGLKKYRLKLSKDFGAAQISWCSLGSRVVQKLSVFQKNILNRVVFHQSRTPHFYWILGQYNKKSRWKTKFCLIFHLLYVILTSNSFYCNPRRWENLKTVRVQAHGGSNPSPSVRKACKQAVCRLLSFLKSEVYGPLFYNYWAMFAILNWCLPKCLLGISIEYGAPNWTPASLRLNTHGGEIVHLQRIYWTVVFSTWFLVVKWDYVPN